MEQFVQLAICCPGAVVEGISKESKSIQPVLPDMSFTRNQHIISGTKSWKSDPLKKILPQIILRDGFQDSSWQGTPMFH